MRFSEDTGHEWKIRLEHKKETAIRLVRSILFRVLSTGRTEARVTIYRHIVLLLEIISEFESEEVARAAGYEIFMMDAMFTLEGMVLGSVCGTILDI